MLVRHGLVLALLFLVSSAWSAVSSEVSRSDYVGNGAVAAYSTTYPVKATSELRVFTQDADGQDVELSLGADYSAALNTSGLATITLTAGNLTSGYKLSIQRGIPYTQTYNPAQSGAYNAASLGTALDRLAMEVIRLKGDVDRSIKVPYLEAGGDSVVKLDDNAAARAGQALVFDSSGNAMAGVATASVSASAWAQTLLDDTTAAAARTTLGFPTALDDMTVLATGTTTRRSLATRFSEKINVLDEGAAGDGSADDTAEINAAISLANGKPVVVPKATSYNTSALTATSARIESKRVVFDNGIDLDYGLDPSDLPIGQAMTWSASERFVQSFRNSSKTGYQTYEAAYPSVNSWDTLQGVTYIASGSTIENASGVAGYIWNADASPANGVCLFGSGVAAVSSSHVWGLNTLLTDNTSRTVGALTGQTMIGAELDFNVMNTATTLIGASVGGNSLSQPANAQGFIVNSLGSGIKWKSGFSTIDGAVDSSSGFALAIGADAASGSNVASQRIGMNWRDSGGTARVAIAQVTSGFLVLQTTGTWSGVKINTGNLYLDNNQGIVINGNVVVYNRQTGWTAPTGTVSRATFDQSTVTLPQLAQRVAALINDLTTHGLIGP